jgi:AcrR family transcriptional regulator
MPTYKAYAKRPALTSLISKRRGHIVERSLPKIVPGYSDAARAKVADAAIKVFAEKGYSEATMDDIAKELGVTKGALYHYYRWKVDILKEIYRGSHKSVRDFFHKSLRDSDPVDGLQGLFDLATGYYKEFAPVQFEILSFATQDEKVRSIVREDYREDLAIIEKYLQTQIKKGRIRSDVDVKFLASSLQALSLGMLMTNLLGSGTFEDRNARKESMALLLGVR